MIQLVEVTNPFLPASSRKLHQVEWREGITLADVLEAAGITTVRHTCVIDGLAVPEEMLVGFTAADNSVIVTMPSVGGGFGKMFAEIAVIIAASAVTWGLATPGALAAFGGSLTSSVLSSGMASLIGAGISLGGNLLINWLMGNHGSAPDSATFDPTGPKTVASGGTPIPKGYGTMLSGGNIIASYVSAEGADNYLNVLVSYGWGTALSITDININNNSISNFIGVTYQTRLGTNNQTPIPNFNNIVNGYPQDVRCIAPAGGGSAVVIEGTGTATQGLEVVIQFPQGVYWQKPDGSLRSLSIAYQIQYAVSGTGDWKNPVIPYQTTNLITFSDAGVVTYAPGWVVVPTDQNYSSGVVYAIDNSTSPTAHTPGDPWSGTETVTYFNADGSSYTGTINLVGEWQVCDPTLNQQIVLSWMAGWVIFTDANQSCLYHTTRIFNLPPNKYDVQVLKYGSAFAGDPIQPLEANNDITGDQVWVHSINEIEYQDLAYPNMILLGVRALATNQLSGSNMNITAMVQYDINATLPAELAGFGTDNPAIVAYDMLVAPFYGGGVDPSKIDIPAWVAWAEFNDELVSDGFEGTIKRHVFNGVFDSQGTNLWKSLQRVATMSQACIVQIGQFYTVVIDAPVTVPAQVFTSANILRDSIKDTWISLDDRANRIEVTFADAGRNYRTDEPCAVILPSDIAAGVEVKTTRVQLLGCTNRAQAWHWAYRKLLSTDVLLLSRSFDVGIEAVACQVGSVIGVQDDVTNFAQGGRIQCGSTSTSLIVDRDDLTFASGEGWTVSILHPVVQRGTATIDSIAGKVLNLAAPLPTTRILSIQNAAGLEGIVEGFGTSTLTLQSVTGFAAGQTITLYDQDVLDTQPISALSGNTLTPLNPFIQTPTADCPWVYGQSAGAFPAKLFTVTNIRRKGDLQVTIDCLQYDASVYADDTPIITETLGSPDVQCAVTSLILKEQYVLASGANGGQASQIAVSWQNGPNTVATQLWVAQNDPSQPLSRETLVQTVSKGTTAVLSYPTGAIVQVRAVGVDATGVTAPYSTAPVQTITVQGAGLAPGDVPNFSGALSTTSAALTWGAATGAANYEVRYNADINNTNWQSATLLYSGSALNWTDSIPRLGCYLIKALSSDSVESVNVSSWSYLQSPTRINFIGLAPGQTVNVIVSANPSGSVTLTCPTQVLFRLDGSPFQLPASTLTLSGLTSGTSYIIYTYLDQTNYALHSGAGDTSVPDTSANPTHAAVCSAGTNYPGPVMTVVNGGAGTGTGADFDVETDYDSSGSYPFYTVTSITVTAGGSGYSSPTVKLSGRAVSGASTIPHTETLGRTVVSGAITSVSGWGTTTEWLDPPFIVVT